MALYQHQRTKWKDGIPKLEAAYIFEESIKQDKKDHSKDIWIMECCSEISRKPYQIDNHTKLTYLAAWGLNYEEFCKL